MAIREPRHDDHASRGCFRIVLIAKESVAATGPRRILGDVRRRPCDLSPGASCARSIAMAKGQKRGNRETKKPKQEKKAPAVPVGGFAVPGSKTSGNRGKS